MTAAKPLISAIVCTHNRSDVLPSCLQSLVGQNLPPEQYEIIVVDNGSTDTTRAICDGYCKRENFRYVFEAIPGLSQARNRGWQEARGDFIGYIDDDAVAEPQWLAKALECFSLPLSPDWVGGSVTLVFEEGPPSWLTPYYYHALGWVDWGKKARTLDPASEWLVGCNSLFRRSILEKLGGFDTRLGRKKKQLLSGEEVQLHHRMRAAGAKFYYHPKVHVHHQVAKKRVLPGYFYRRYYWGGVTDYLLAKTLSGMPSQLNAKETETRAIKSSRLGRLCYHAYYGLIPFAQKKKAIQSRIYLSYVVGQLAAMLRYRLTMLVP